MMDPRPWDPMSRMAGAAVVASLLLFLGTVAGAWMIAPLPYTGAADSSVWVAGNGNHSSPIPPRAIRTVADNNPFRPGRDRPPSRYLPPSQRVLASQVTARPAVFVPAFVLEGIAWTPGRPGVAVIGVAGRPARLLREGEVIESFRIRTIEETRVTLSGADTTVVLSLEPLAGGPGTSNNNRGRIR